AQVVSCSRPGRTPKVHSGHPPGVGQDLDVATVDTGIVQAEVRYLLDRFMGGCHVWQRSTSHEVATVTDRVWKRSCWCVDHEVGIEADPGSEKTLKEGIQRGRENH